MNWKEIYDARKVTAEEAVSYIESNTTVLIGHASGEPSVLVDALVARHKELENVELVHSVSMGKTEYCKPEMAKHFYHTAFACGPASREACNTGRGGHISAHLHVFPSLYGTKEMPVDAAIVSVSPPDKHGYCSFGISVDFTKPLTECAKMVIAEINDQMPRVMGDTFIHVSKFDHIVEASHPLIELQPAKITDVEREIARHCVSLIEDGATLQVGIGGIPEAVCSQIQDKQNLGFHSEMAMDSLVPLVENGVITNQNKGFHGGKSIACFAMGTKRLYDWLDENPQVELYPCNYTNDPLNIMKCNKVTSINSALQIDFTGQVNAESLGQYQMSGIGGQVDFVRGSQMSPGGKSIIAFTSTAAKGTKSKIVPFLDFGSKVTTSRYDVEYVITEYGIARLKGLRDTDRARTLINIAHPKFRDELKDQFKEVFKTSFNAKR